MISSEREMIPGAGFGGFGVADLSWNLAHDLWVRSGGDGQRRDGEKGLQFLKEL